MAYEKHTWTCDEDITADLLNHMENGIAEAGSRGTLLVKVIKEGDTERLDHTWQEIYDSVTEGNGAFWVDETTGDDEYTISLSPIEEVGYSRRLGEKPYYVSNRYCSSPNEYPTTQ